MYKKKVIEPKENKIQYLTFNANNAYKQVKELNPFLPSGEHWNKLYKVQRLKVVYTYLYKYSLEQKQNAKYTYYKNRAIHMKNKWLNKLGYIKAQRYDDLLEKLTTVFPLDFLEEQR